MKAEVFHLQRAKIVAGHLWDAEVRSVIGNVSRTPIAMTGIKNCGHTGCMGDLAIRDPDKSVTIKNSILHHAADYTPYEGMEVRGWPVTTISRGEIVWSEGTVMSNAGRGRFIVRARPLQPRTAPIMALEGKSGW